MRYRIAMHCQVEIAQEIQMILHPGAEKIGQPILRQLQDHSSENSIQKVDAGFVSPPNTLGHYWRPPCAIEISWPL